MDGWQLYARAYISICSFDFAFGFDARGGVVIFVFGVFPFRGDDEVAVFHAVIMIGIVLGFLVAPTIVITVFVGPVFGV